MIETIEWEALPSIPWITSRLISSKEEYVSLFGGDFRSESDRALAKERRLASKRMPGLGSVLRKGYKNIAIPPEVEKNLAALDKSDTLSIISGQQVGIFGGPLYTFYKAFTTILLAESLRKESSGAVVPVFWMETGDADFTEVNQVKFPSDNGEPRKSVYAPVDLVAGKPVSYHTLTDDIDEVRTNVINWIKKLPHSRQFINLIESAYQSGRPMADAFRELMTGLFGDRGLVLIDPMDSAISERTGEFWDKCLSSPETLNRPFEIGAERVQEKRLPLQSKLRKDTLPIYSISNDGFRNRIFKKESGWSVGQNGSIVSGVDLHNLGVKFPSKLSPAVLLRPLLQDWLLPTWIYVGGPSEIAYHAQIGEAYEHLEIPRPLIAPRISLTLLDRADRRNLGKNSWSVRNVFGGRELLLREGGKSDTIIELFNSGMAHLDGWKSRIRRVVNDTGITIDEELDKASRKIAFQWDKLRQTTLRKIGQKDEVRLNHANKLLNRLMPGGVQQERHDNALYYLSLYGPQLTGLIAKVVDPFKPQHIAVDIEEEL